MGHWDRGDDVTTEELRLALRRYRSFFGRLLSVYCNKALMGWGTAVADYNAGKDKTAG